MLTPDYGDVMFDDPTDRNAPTPECYEVAVPPIAVNGAMTLSLRLQFGPNGWIEIGAVGIHVSSPVSAVEFPPSGPQAADPQLLRQNYPNPFRPATSIEFVVDQQGPVALRIFSVTGQLVRTLFSGEVSAGEHTVDWDGTNDTGRSLPSGTYYYRLTIDGREEARQMILIR